MTTILIAEDEPDIRQLVELTLSFGGFTVLAAANGAEAVEKAKADRPDLILLDVRMPRMTGYEACAALKEDAATANIPVVFLSAKGQEDEVRSGLGCGAADYILKPFSPEQLISRVRELVAQHAAEEDAATKPAAQDAAEKDAAGEAANMQDTTPEPVSEGSAAPATPISSNGSHQQQPAK